MDLKRLEQKSLKIAQNRETPTLIAPTVSSFHNKQTHRHPRNLGRTDVPRYKLLVFTQASVRVPTRLHEFFSLFYTTPTSLACYSNVEKY